MNGSQFSLATFSGGPAGPFAAIVLGETAFSIAGIYPAYRDSARGKAGPLTATAGIQEMLEGWDHNFPVLQEIVAFIEEEGADSDRFAAVSGAVDGLRAMPPVLRPRKDIERGAEFSGTCGRDDPRRQLAQGRAALHRRPVDLDALSVPQGLRRARRRP